MIERERKRGQIYTKKSRWKEGRCRQSGEEREKIIFLLGKRETAEANPRDDKGVKEKEWQSGG